MVDKNGGKFELFRNFKKKIAFYLNRIFLSPKFIESGEKIKILTIWALKPTADHTSSHFPVGRGRSRWWPHD